MIIINLQNITKKKQFCPKKIEFINWARQFPSKKKNRNN